MAKSNSGDSTIKFLIYLLLFLIFVLLILVLLIIPSMKEFRTQRSDFKTYTSQNHHLSQKQVALSQEIADFKKEHNKALQLFSQDFNKTTFLAFAKGYFSQAKLTKGEVKNIASQFKEYTFKATTSSKTPRDFYAFIEALDSYPAIIKINFPITLTSKNNQIEVDFNLSIFKQNNQLF